MKAGQNHACYRHINDGVAMPAAQNAGRSLGQCRAGWRRLSSTLAVCAWMLCFGIAPALAQDILDASFVSVDHATALAIQPDGKIVIGGNFATVRRLNSDGSVDATFVGAQTDSSWVSAIVPLPNGKLIIGGSFSQVGGQPASAIARLNADGTLDGSFAPNVVGSGTNSIALLPDGKLLVAGNFTSIDGTGARSLTRLNADGSRDPTFASPILSTQFDSVIGFVTSMSTRADGKILVAGEFFLAPPNANADNVSTLVRLNADGTVDADLTTVVGFQQGGAVAVQPDGRVLASGLGGNNQYARIVRLNADDTLDSGFNPHSNDLALTFFVQPNGKIVVAGLFTTIGGQPHNYIARLNADGSIDSSFDSAGTGGPNGAVAALAAQADGRILIGGDFTNVGAQQIARPGLARLLVPEAAIQQLSFGADHTSVRWQRSGSGTEFGRATFETSNDGGTWNAVADGVWNAGIWNLGGLSAPDGDLWLRARGYASTGGGDYGFSGLIIESTRQLVATVAPGAGAGGSIEPSSPQFADTGSTISFTIVPANGQRILSVLGSCGGTLSGNIFTTSVVTANCSVLANFTFVDNFIVTPAASMGGSVAPSVPQAVQPGGTLALTLTPDSGHVLVKVVGTCGGALAGNNYTTAPVYADCTVQANFAIATYTVTSSAGANGSIAPAVQTVTAGASAALIVTPDFGYNANVSGCGGTLSGTTYTTAPITADCGVAATFAPISEAGASLVVTIAPYVNGPVCGTQSTLAVNEGDFVTFCYTYTNHTGRTLPWQYFSDTKGITSYGPGFPIAESLANGQSKTLFNTAYIFQSQDVAVTWVGLDDIPPRYSFDDTVSFDWVELAASPTAEQLPIDTARPYSDAQVQMPFSIDFYGFPTDGKLCVDKNGTLRFHAGLPCSSSEYWYFPDFTIAIARTTLPSYDGGGAPYVGGAVYYETQGNAPNRRTIIEWSQMHLPFGGDLGNPVTFEAIIDETSGAITFQYLAMDTGNPNTVNGKAAIAQLMREPPDWGVPAPDPTIIYSNYQPNLTAGKAIRFAASANPFRASANATARAQIATPVAAVTPGLLDISVAAGASTSTSLTIRNDGNAALNWNVGETAGSPGFHIDTVYATAAQTSAARVASANWNKIRPGDARLVQLQQRSGKQATSPPLIAPTVDAAVPAYALAIQNSQTMPYFFGSLDTVAPAILNPIGDAFSAIQVGALIDNDFSREYLASNGFCGDNGCRVSDFGYISTVDGSHRIVASGPTSAPYVPGHSDSESWAGIKWDHTMHTLYGVASNGGSGNSAQFALCGTAPVCRSDLFTIDPTTGASTWIAQVDPIDPSLGTLIADIAIAPNGDLYGLNMIDDTFYGIDKTTGHVRPIGPSGLGVGYYPWQSMDFNQTSGILYYATWPAGGAPSAVFTIDLTTGAATQVGAIGDGTSSLRGLAIAKPGGPCASPSDVPWMSFDTSSGSINPANSAIVTVTFNTIGLADGVYTAKICVDTNTRFDSTIAVPVTFTVGSGDRIFTNGFDSTP